MTALALNGGKPLRSAPWPQWPQSTPGAEQEVLRSMRQGRWSISGPIAEFTESYEARFARAFAEYNGSAFCIPTASGTSALMCAMQAMGIGAGNEVIVPGLTWAACANAVTALNATPVLVDVDADTLCLDVVDARQAISARTRAIMVVHLYNAIADMDQFVSLSEETGILILEDCAQAHGARWRGRRVGTIGKAGTFSMQNSKVLTAGEGGACICDDPELADRVYRLRTDGRRLISLPVKQGHSQLEECGGVFGQNFCISEMQAAILYSRLVDLDGENALRALNAATLKTFLTEIGGLGFQASAPGTESTTLYHLPVRLENPGLRRLGSTRVGEALSAELNCWVHPTYMPLNQHPLLDTGKSMRISNSPICSSPLQRAWEAHRNTVVLPHWLFLAEDTGMEAIAAAFEKVMRLQDTL